MAWYICFTLLMCAASGLVGYMFGRAFERVELVKKLREHNKKANERIVELQITPVTREQGQAILAEMLKKAMAAEEGEPMNRRWMH